MFVKDWVTPHSKTAEDSSKSVFAFTDHFEGVIILYSSNRPK